MTGAFPSQLQKYFLSLRKIKHMNITTIVQSPCYKILTKYLKNLFKKDCITFSITITLSITYSLDNENNILHLMP